MTNAIAGAAGSKPVMRKMPAKRGDSLAGGPPAGQEGKAAELAAAAPFPAGDGPSCAGGAGLPVDGGLAAAGIHAFARDRMDAPEDAMGGRDPAMSAIMDRMRR